MAYDGYLGNRVPEIKPLVWHSTVPTGLKNIDEVHKREWNTNMYWGPGIFGIIGYFVGDSIGLGAGTGALMAAAFGLWAAWSAQADRDKRQVSPRDQLWLNLDQTREEHREAFIEERGDGFWFVVLSGPAKGSWTYAGEVRWDDFDVFQDGSYIEYFGDRADRDDVTDTRVIVAPCHNGHTLLVTNTTGGIAGIRKLHTALTRSFGETARRTFLEERAARIPRREQTNVGGNGSGEVPPDL